MKNTFKYQKEKKWPPLAWIAICLPDHDLITVHHGPDVDTRSEWFCEAAWDGEYADGNFDRTNTIFGSGCRIRGDDVYFISSGFVSDRLQHIQIGRTWYISNSLACLAAVLDLNFDPWYPWYYEDFSSITEGIDNYKPAIETNQGEVKLTYYRNLLWDGVQLSEIDKPQAAEKFHDFSSYHEFLSATLACLASNLGAVERTFTYESVSTSSSGYDSLAVSVLSKAMNNHDVICVPDDRIGRSDNGTELIKKLGMNPLVIDRNAWRDEAFAEAPFIAADGCGRDAWLSAAHEHLPRRLLLTGNFGGWSWAIPARNSPNNFYSASPPGLSMSEFRLITGYLHCPVPCLGVEHIGTIRNIGASEEMQDWSIGGRYDRPIPRRIIEQAGLLRGSFAVRKTATNIHLFRKNEFDRYMAGTASFRDYMQWLRKQSRLTPPPAEMTELTVPARERIEIPLFRHMFPWAIEHVKQYYKG